MIADLFYMFLTFFKIGLFTIGGGYAMIPLIQADVIKNNWLTMEALTDFIAIAESTPGPFAINIATFIGMNQYGILGAAITTLGIVLPSFLIILLVAKWFLNFKDNRFVKAGPGKILPPINAITSVSTAMANAICAAREEKPFTTREDVLNRSGIGPAALDKLIASGILDHLPASVQIDLFSML